MDAQWYAVFSKPRKELQVDSYLRNHGVKTFFPTYRVKPVNPRSSTTRAFFPRYLFVYADLSETGMSALQWVPGAVGLVQFDGEPAPIPDYFIDELRKRIAAVEAAGGLNLDGLRKGDQVKITSGPFAGYDALFDMRLTGEERVQVLLHWLGREVKVKVDMNAIEKRRAR